MNRAKYIVINAEFPDTPVLFPVWCSHQEVARALVGIDGIESGQVLSAGFVRIETALMDTPNGQEAGVLVECFGESTSMDMKPQKIDAFLIEKMLGLKS